VKQCKKCGSENNVKAGFIKGEQRYKCKDCGCQFVPTRHHGRPEKTKQIARLLYVCGLSLRTIGRIVHADASAVLDWVRDYARAAYEKPKPVSDEVVVELDEMWHYLQSKKTRSGSGKLIVEIPVNLSTGSAEGAITLRFQGFTND